MTQYPEISLAKAKEDLGKARDADSGLVGLKSNELLNAPEKASERESGKKNLEKMIWGCSAIADRMGRQMGRIKAKAERM